MNKLYEKIGRAVIEITTISMMATGFVAIGLIWFVR